MPKPNKEQLENASIGEKSPAKEVLDRMAEDQGGQEALDSLYKKTKPNFFSRLVGNYSTEYANLEKAYQAFKNPGDDLYGDMDALRNAAMDYAAREIPDFDPSQPIPEESLSNLSAAEKARAEFASSVIRSVDAQKKEERASLGAENEDGALNEKYSESFGFSEEEEAIFQANVKEDVEKDEIDSVIEEEEEVLDVPEKEISVGA